MAPPAGEQTGHSAAARGCQGASPEEIRRGVGPDRLQKPPSRGPRRTLYLAAGAGRDAAVSCRPWGARAPASRSACFWPPRSWPGHRRQRGNAPTPPPSLPGARDPAPRHRGLPCSPERWPYGSWATTWRGSPSLALPCLALPLSGLGARIGNTNARMCAPLRPALFLPALANLRLTWGAALLSDSSLTT